MSAMVFRLKRAPDQRLDLAPLIPSRLAGLTARAIEAIEIQTTREPVSVGDIFGLRHGDAGQVRFEGGSDRFDNIAANLDGGAVLVDGDVGSSAGRMMVCGDLTVSGSAGPWVASAMRGGRMTIRGDVGDFLGAPFPAEMAGMRGGYVHVQGNAGARAGDRQRRGVVVIDGNTGPYPGSRMIAGSLIIGGKAGILPGYLMRRGTIMLGREPESMSPGFVECGTHEPVFARLIARTLDEQGIVVRSWLRRRLLRFGGDMSVMGKGEVLLGR